MARQILILHCKCNNYIIGVFLWMARKKLMLLAGQEQNQPFLNKPMGLFLRYVQG